MIKCASPSELSSTSKLSFSRENKHIEDSSVLSYRLHLLGSNVIFRLLAQVWMSSYPVAAHGTDTWISPITRKAWGPTNCARGGKRASHPTPQWTGKLQWQVFGKAEESAGARFMFAVSNKKHNEALHELKGAYHHCSTNTRTDTARAKALIFSWFRR